jgi:hypothetical protein
MNVIRSVFRLVAAVGVAWTLFVLAGCGSHSKNAGFDQGADGGGGSTDTPAGDATVVTDDGGSQIQLDQGDSAPAPKCTTGGELGCYVPTGCTTTLSGTVHDPAGRNPIFNAVVFVPNSTTGTLPKITPGNSGSCNTCDASIGNYVAATQTDAKGHFTLTGVPATSHVPLVVQIGKWRREVFLPEVKACTNNVVPAADSRLPRSKAEGDMPQIALLTGFADQLGCFLTGLGIANSEWSGPHRGGRVDVYSGTGGAGVTNGTAGACASGNCPLWDTLAGLEYYDIVLMACEGGTNDAAKGAPAMSNMRTWLNHGGKMFGTHFHYTWFSDGPTYGCAACSDLAGTANWQGVSGGIGTGNYTIDTSFYGGKMLQQWMQNLGQVTGNQITLDGVANSVGTVKTGAQRWIYDPATNSTKYLTVLTPIGGVPASTAADAGMSDGTGPHYCGKAVFTDLHAGGVAFGAGALPDSCNASTPFTAQEAALEFLFFDLSACVSIATQAPMLPPPVLQ